MSSELCVRANLFVRKFDGIGVIHSLPLIADRRIRAQSVEGAQEMFCLFFDDGVNGNFFVPESRFRSLLATGEMSSGLVSGSRLAGGCFVIRGPAGSHTRHDSGGKEEKCNGHEALIFKMNRAAVVEAMARLEDLHTECAKLFGAADGLAPWEPFPRSADQRFVEIGMRACGALSSVMLGDAAEMTEEERTAFLDSCFKDRSEPDEPEQVEEEPEKAQEPEGSGKSDDSGEGEKEKKLRADLIRKGIITPAEHADKTNSQ